MLWWKWLLGDELQSVVKRVKRDVDKTGMMYQKCQGFIIYWEITSFYPSFLRSDGQAENWIFEKSGCCL